ncbi:sulfotransferase [Bosea sp. (in: a-proteobacteria)]|uniref:sulfotransferase family protein n=1 Tax=Bosea sp. (in: a-proteobacteria) TaxID=1871050 RepID=UPI002630BEBB|nr:sulfotransferase [Bosea sp. (in: a-proteobacteria)]MCO5092072.1 sulfotransferase [Bosea sp. (in: a-proteobacteria)]
MNSVTSTDFSLDLINSALSVAERKRIRNFDRPQLRPVVVVGAPRSGHTLFSQLLAASGAFGFISNFTARFWNAPVLAAELQRSLGLSEAPVFTSDHGRISGWTAPHEGGRFLQRLIKLGETHVADERPAASTVSEWRSELAALEDFHQRNVMLRNVIYGLNLPILFEALPNALIVVCRRDPLYQAQSIYEARIKGAGADTWWSAKPANSTTLMNLEWPQQIAGQIAGCYEAIDKHRAAFKNNFIDISYEAYCANPQDQVAAVLGAAGIAAPTNSLPSIVSTNTKREPDDVIDRLHQALSTTGL